ncbi:S1C family serine protease [Clostridium sp. DL1XJH146]
MNDDKDDVKDVAWEDVTNHCIGEIKIVKKKNKNPIKYILLALLFVSIASFSGVISSIIIVNNKLENLDMKYIPMIQSNNEDKEEFTGTSSINYVAEKVGPAVVGITNYSDTLGGEQGVGSGIIFKSDGYIVTNNHVIEGAKEIFVNLANDSDPIAATVVGTDEVSDLAVIKIDVSNLPVAEFGDSSLVRVGDIAIAIGNPFGDEFAGTVTAGIISATNREIRQGSTVYKVIQTDAAINPGNSGGALCNINGEIIGINSLKMGSQQDSFQNAEGLGFAIKIDEAKDIVNQLMENGRVSRPRLGIWGRDSTKNDSDEVQGAYIQRIIENSGAQKAGLRAGDIIIEVDNIPISQFEELSDEVEKHNVDDIINIKVMRDEETKEFEVQLMDIGE